MDSYKFLRYAKSRSADGTLRERPHYIHQGVGMMLTDIILIGAVALVVIVVFSAGWLVYKDKDSWP